MQIQQALVSYQPQFNDLHFFDGERPLCQNLRRWSQYGSLCGFLGYFQRP